MQVSISKNSLFTVYQTDRAIVLCQGADDVPNWQALHSSRSYELAYNFAQVAATHRGVLLKNLVSVPL